MKHIHNTIYSAIHGNNGFRMNTAKYIRLNTFNDSFRIFKITFNNLVIDIWSNLLGQL